MSLNLKLKILIFTCNNPKVNYQCKSFSKTVVKLFPKFIEIVTFLSKGQDKGMNDSNLVYKRVKSIFKDEMKNVDS